MLFNAVQRSERGRLVLLGLLVVVFIPRVCRRGSWGSYPVTITSSDDLPPICSPVIKKSSTELFYHGKQKEPKVNEHKLCDTNALNYS